MSNPYSQNPQQFSAPNNPDVYGGNGGYQQQTNNPQQGIAITFQNNSCGLRGLVWYNYRYFLPNP